MKVLVLIMFISLIRFELAIAAKKCYCEESITGGHIGYNYTVGDSQGCCSGTAAGNGIVTTWATDNHGHEWDVNDEVKSSSTIQKNCCPDM